MVKLNMALSGSALGEGNGEGPLRQLQPPAVITSASAGDRIIAGMTAMAGMPERLQKRQDATVAYWHPREGDRGFESRSCPKKKEYVLQMREVQRGN